MKCVLCGGNVKRKHVEEEIRVNHDFGMVNIDAEVCENCGERYFDEGVVDHLRSIKHSLVERKLKTRKIGSVYEIV